MKQIKLTIDKFLKEKSMSRYELSKITGIHYNTIDKYYKNKVTRYDSYVLLNVCIALNCEISDIIKIEDLPDEEV